MSDFPNYRRPGSPNICCDSLESLGFAGRQLGAISGGTAWPNTKQVVYIPFTISDPIRVTRMYYFLSTTGTAATVDMGIYNSDGVLLGSTGATSTTGATTQTLFFASLTSAITLGPGSYYMAINGAWSTVAPGARARAIGTPFIRAIQAGVLKEIAATSALPTTATFATTDGFIPFMGLGTPASVNF